MVLSYYNTTSVLLCLGITALVCLSVTVFSFQTKPVAGPEEGQAARAADPFLSPQFDFTSCQGVLFVLLMTLFFSGLILAILLPFQYVSLWVLRQAPWGGKGPTGRRCRSLPSPQGRPGAKAPQPAILRPPPPPRFPPRPTPAPAPGMLAV
ncbi:hypothetical protein P7K49_019862 [Saguinus oedipus]|uniref:Protein lifeguard 2 n=1 Tax=Saguinus oedipus TaxID=9490 RepID=A0ABQ9UZL0_SAGOE|nr:hypothetical protein P7K49_019862 [Saguinus oedipus]